MASLGTFRGGEKSTRNLSELPAVALKFSAAPSEFKKKGSSILYNMLFVALRVELILQGSHPSFQSGDGLDQFLDRRCVVRQQG